MKRLVIVLVCVVLSGCVPAKQAAWKVVHPGQVTESETKVYVTIHEGGNTRVVEYDKL